MSMAECEKCVLQLKCLKISRQVLYVSKGKLIKMSLTILSDFLKMNEENSRKISMRTI